MADVKNSKLLAFRSSPRDDSEAHPIITLKATP